jgi:hypothetical protein
MVFLVSNVETVTTCAAKGARTNRERLVSEPFESATSNQRPASVRPCAPGKKACAVTGCSSCRQIFEKAHEILSLSRRQLKHDHSAPGAPPAARSWSDASRLCAVAAENLLSLSLSLRGQSGPRATSRRRFVSGAIGRPCSRQCGASRTCGHHTPPLLLVAAPRCHGARCEERLLRAIATGCFSQR